MKNTYRVFLGALLTIFISACGGGGDAEGGVSNGSGVTTRPEPYPSYPYQPDITFGTTPNYGASIIDWGLYQSSASVAHDVAVLSDGKYLTTGVVQFGYPEAGRFLFVARYLSNGQLDSSFGINGIVKIRRNTSRGRRILPLPNGQFLVAADDGGEICVIRFNADGSVDSTFADKGWFHYISLKVENPVSLLLDSKQRLLVVADGGTVLRLSYDGVLDPTWATAGVSTTLYKKISEPMSALIQTDGKILVSGRLAAVGSHGFATVTRFNEDGTFDASFGADQDGTVRYSYDNGPIKSVWALFSTMQLDSDGKITAGGMSWLHSYTIGYDVLAKFNPDGSVDTTFGNNGQVVTSWDLPAVGIPVVMASSVQDSQGRITTVSSIRIPYKVNEDLNLLTTVTALARYLPNGQLDTSFGVDGRRVIYKANDGYNNNPSHQMNSIKLDSANRYIMAGAGSQTMARPSIVRMLP